MMCPFIAIETISLQLASSFFNASLSPENTYLSESGAHCLTYMPNMDREILFDFFKICREFGFDAPEIEQVKPASDGRIPEWCEEFGEKEPEHRHVSHLYCVYPSPFECSDELKKACEKSLYARGFGGTGWSLGWKVCLWARLGNAENANTLIKNQLRPKHPKVNIFYSGGGSYPNLLDAHPPFQIDGNFGGCAGIAEMLLQSQAGQIELLPALPSAWKNGSFKGLKVRGGGEVSAKWKEGRLTEAGLKALVSDSFRIKLPVDSANMSIKVNQKAVSLPVVDGMLVVELQAGDQLVLKF